MTEAERQHLSAAAQDAERLRNDPAFKAAILSLREAKMAEMQREQDSLIAAMLNGQSASIEAIRTLKAEIKAIDGICQEIATAILRAPRKPMAVA